MLRGLTLSTLIVFFTVANGIARAAAEEPLLNIYNWADYIGADTVANFEAEYGIEVNYDIYETSEMVDAKLMAGNSGYDLVLHSAAFSSRLISVGIYQPLDKTRLPNWKHLDPALLDRFDHFDPGVRFGVPYMWGTTGFTYNVDMIRERMPDAPVESGDLLFKAEVVAKFADCGVSLLDSPISVIPVVLAYLGYKADSVDPRQLKEVELLLKSKVGAYTLEKRNAEAESMRKIAAASTEGNFGKAMEVSSQMQAAPEVKGVTVKSVWLCKVTDMSKVPRKYLTLNHGAIATHTKLTKGKPAAIPGLRFYEEAHVTARTAR